MLGHSKIGAGKYAEAMEVLGECAAIWRAHGNHGGVASAMVNHGVAAFRSGDYELAEQSGRESLAIFQRNDEKSGVAVAWNLLGDCRRLQRQFAVANTYYQRSLVEYGAIKNEFGQAIVQMHVALGAAEANDEDGDQRLAAALRGVADIGLTGLTATFIPEIGRFIARKGLTQTTVELLTFATTVPQIEAYDRATAAELLAELREELDSAEFATATERGKQLTLEQTVDQAIMVLTH